MAARIFGVPAARDGKMGDGMRKPLQIAHRGGAGLWPENTMAAFEHAIAMGADASGSMCILSRDGQLIVHHDESLK